MRHTHRQTDRQNMINRWQLREYKEFGEKKYDQNIQHEKTIFNENVTRKHCVKHYNSTEHVYKFLLNQFYTGIYQL